MFLDGYSPPETPWLILGTGLRVMQDSGVHRKLFSKKRSLEKELWKRAFWLAPFRMWMVKNGLDIVTQGLGRAGPRVQHTVG